MQNQTLEQSTSVTQKQLDSLKCHLEDLIKRSKYESLNDKRNTKTTFVSWCQKSDVNGVSKILEYFGLF